MPGLAEGAVSLAAKSIIVALGGEWWSTESGYVVQTNREGVAIPRRGGTRTTPGIPDILAHLPLPGTKHWYWLTVEAKGSKTAIKPEQWGYCDAAARHGLMHLLVRSPDELLSGLSYVGLLPERPWDYDNRCWPQNLNFLPEQARGFWAVYWHVRGGLKWSPGPLPQNDRPQPQPK